MFEMNPVAIRNLFLERGLTLHQFAEQSRLNFETVKNALAGKPLSAKVVSTLAKFFGVPAETILKEE